MGVLLFKNNKYKKKIVYLVFYFTTYFIRMNALVIFNKKAGGGKASGYVEEIKDLFLKNSVNANMKFTEYQEHAIKLVAEANLSDIDAIITVGGDGTFHECLNGYFQNENKRDIPLGILPFGTGNSLTRDIYDRDYSSYDFK